MHYRGLKLTCPQGAFYGSRPTGRYMGPSDFRFLVYMFLNTNNILTSMFLDKYNVHNRKQCASPDGVCED